MAWTNYIIFFFILFSCVFFTCHTDFSAGVKAQELQARDNNCICGHYTCGCCLHLEFPKIRLNDTGCVNITYLPNDYGISFTMTIDNLTIYNETISAHNPPPICFGAPIIEKYAELCIRFYDLDATKTSLHGCVDIEARLHKVVVGRYNIGCFDIGKKSLGRWKKYHHLLIQRIRAIETWVLHNRTISANNSINEFIKF